jgi:4-amino-4-deoxy-L-arabinose transferase-like glycosyltransferase
LIQFFLGSVTCVLIYLISEKIINKKAALISAVIAVLYLPFIFYEGEILPTSLEVFLLTAVIYLCVLSYERSCSKFLVIMSGIGMGGFLLIRTNAIVLAPIITIFLVLNNKNFREKLRWIIFYLIGLSVLLGLNIFYNYEVTGKASFLPPHGGESFYVGNNPEATGTEQQPSFVDPNPFFEHESYRKRASEILGRELTLNESSNFWLKQGLKFISSHPLKYLSLLIRKIFLFINTFEISDNNNYYFFKKFSSILSLPFFSTLFVIPLGLFGLLVASRYFKKIYMISIPLFFYVLSVILFFINSRYRMPVIPQFIILAAAAIYILAEAIFRKNRNTLIKYAIILLSIFIVTNLSLPDKKRKLATAYYNYGFILEAKNKLEEARQQYEEAVVLNPGLIPALLNLSRVYAKQNDFNNAYAILKKVLAIDPNNAQALQNIKFLETKGLLR